MFMKRPFAQNCTVMHCEMDIIQILQHTDNSLVAKVENLTQNEIQGDLLFWNEIHFWYKQLRVDRGPLVFGFFLSSILYGEIAQLSSSQPT